MRPVRAPRGQTDEISDARVAQTSVEDYSTGMRRRRQRSTRNHSPHYPPRPHRALNKGCEFRPELQDNYSPEQVWSSAHATADKSWAKPSLSEVASTRLGIQSPDRSWTYFNISACSFRQRLGRIRPSVARIRPMFVKFAGNWAKLGQHLRSLVDVGRLNHGHRSDKRSGERNCRENLEKPRSVCVCVPRGQCDGEKFVVMVGHFADTSALFGSGCLTGIGVSHMGTSQTWMFASAPCCRMSLRKTSSRDSSKSTNTASAPIHNIHGSEMPGVRLGSQLDREPQNTRKLRRKVAQPLPGIYLARLGFGANILRPKHRLPARVQILQVRSRLDGSGSANLASKRPVPLFACTRTFCSLFRSRFGYPDVECGASE